MKPEAPSTVITPRAPAARPALAGGPSCRPRWLSRDPRRARGRPSAGDDPGLPGAGGTVSRLARRPGPRAGVVHRAGEGLGVGDDADDQALDPTAEVQLVGGERLDIGAGPTRHLVRDHEL